MTANDPSGCIQEITTHYIDGAFVESHGAQIQEIVRPKDGRIIGRVTLGDEVDTRRAIAAAKRSFESYRHSTKSERSRLLRQMHEATLARADELTEAMVNEYGGVAQFSALIVQTGIKRSSARY